MTGVQTCALPICLVLPVLTYLFHKLEARFDGRPTLLVLDEAWLFLDEPLFAARIRDWLKTLRKKNVAVVFATQSLADIAASSIAPAIIESCPTRIFLPNDRAIEAQIKDIYERFGLNPRQIEIIAHATPKQDYYVQTAQGNRLFELDLGSLALAICSAATQQDHKLMDQLLLDHDQASFETNFLRVKGFEAEAEMIEHANFAEMQGSTLSTTDMQASLFADDRDGTSPSTKESKHA